jgi:2C-methyl-D-erythritol 2,4-cyclodiphosphate synthase
MNNNETYTIQELTEELATILKVSPSDLGVVTSTQLKLGWTGLVTILQAIYDLDNTLDRV